MQYRRTWRLYLGRAKHAISHKDFRDTLFFVKREVDCEYKMTLIKDFLHATKIANEPVRDINRWRIFWTKSRIRQVYPNYPMRLNQAVGFSSRSYRSIGGRRSVTKSKIAVLTNDAPKRATRGISSLKNTSAAWSKDRFRFSCKNIICCSFPRCLHVEISHCSFYRIIYMTRHVHSYTIILEDEI